MVDRAGRIDVRSSRSDLIFKSSYEELGLYIHVYGLLGKPTMSYATHAIGIVKVVAADCGFCCPFGSSAVFEGG